MSSGSSYEQYDRTHLTYDKTRLPVGNEQLVELILQGPGKEAHLLDVGCGTGGHLEGFHLNGFTNLFGLDASATGLTQARAKVASAGLVCADMRAMPFADNSFDVLLFSFSLHHLPHGTEDELKEATLGVFKEARRVLKVGGRLLIITCTPEQLSVDGCLWYYKYFPQAAEKLAARFLSFDRLAKLAAQAGLHSFSAEPVKRTYWTEAGLDPEGPFDAAWRNGDSLFALAAADPDKFAAGLAALRADITSGAALTHIESVRRRTEVLKQAVLLSGRS